MRYIVMADGQMRRWHADNQIPKHLALIGQETMLSRLVRQVRSTEKNSEIIITSHDPRYEIPGAVRYEPKNNHIELDRFTWELIEDRMCFLYGDVYYTDAAIARIRQLVDEPLHFLGTPREIVALQVQSGECMKQMLQRVRQQYLDHQLAQCKGWQVYETYTGLKKEELLQRRQSFTLLEDGTGGFNTVEEYQNLLKNLGEK